MKSTVTNIANIANTMCTVGLLVTLCVPELAAQSFTATVSGIITDPSAAAIPEAEVRVTNIETNVSSTTTSDSQGRYVVPALPPGRYMMSVKAAGFKELVRTGIRLEVDQRARLDFVLDVGALSEQVVVTAEAPLVDRERSSLGSVVDNRQIVNVPMNGRNSVQLAALVPGVILGRGFSDENNSSASVFINGGRGNTSEVLIDGISSVTPANNPINVLPGSPPVDAIQEFKVQTNSLSAEFGHTGGGVLNFIFKSGTNELHGSAFEFLRNNVLDANNFFSNRQGIALTGFRRNQFGGTIGGPVVIPGLFNGRDRVFFFASYEGLRESSQGTETYTFPTAAERAGDFSQTFRRSGGNCQAVNIFDPFSTRSQPGGGFVRSQFPNNRIPPTAFDPVARRAAAFYPLPNNPGDSCTGTNNFTASGADTRTVDQVDIRADVNPSSKDKLFVRLSMREIDLEEPDVYNNVASPSGGRLGRINPGRSGTFSYTRVISPSMVAEFRLGRARYEVATEPASGPGFDVRSTLGFAGTFIDEYDWVPTFPSFNVSGYGALGTSGPAGHLHNTYPFAASVTKIKSAHTLKAGVDFRITQTAGPSAFPSPGTYIFQPSFTQGPDPTRSGPTSGNAMASLLIGTGTGRLSIAPRVFTSNTYFAVYLQDDYRVTPRLMLNLGLRYDLENGMKDRYDQLSWFDFTVRSPLADLVPGLPNLRGGLRFVNTDGNPRRLYALDKNNFGPRFGFAYSLNPDTVLRGGYGISYEPFSGRATAYGYTGFSSLTTWVSSLDGITPLNRLQDPFPGGVVLPRGSADGLLAMIGQDLSVGATAAAYDRNARVGYVQQWNFGLQRALPGNISVGLAYAGAKGTKLTDGGGFEESQLPPQFMSLGNRLLERVSNPFFGIIESGPLAAPTTTLGQLLRPYPQYLGLENFRPNAASSIYHAFQTQVEKRLSHGIHLLLAYTAGKVIDDSSLQANLGGLGGSGLHQDFYNRRADRSLSLHDIAQRLVISYVVDLPFGRGKPVGSSWGRLADGILGGWQVNGITTFQSGLAFLIATSSNNSGAFSAMQRPNVNGNPKLADDRPKGDKLARWFDTTMFSQPAAYTFGNAPRVLPNVRGDGTNHFDASLFKNLALSKDGAATLQIRAEAFNLLNAPQFGLPGANFGAGSFGVVSSQQNLPRQVQFGLKILF